MGLSEVFMEDNFSGYIVDSEGCLFVIEILTDDAEFAVIGVRIKLEGGVLAGEIVASSNDSDDFGDGVVTTTVESEQTYFIST